MKHDTSTVRDRLHKLYETVPIVVGVLTYAGLVALIINEFTDCRSVVFHGAASCPFGVLEEAFAGEVFQSDGIHGQRISSAVAAGPMLYKASTTDKLGTNGPNCCGYGNCFLRKS